MDNALTFKEISDLVKAIPSDKWEHSFSRDNEDLEFRMADTDLSLSLFGNNKGKRNGSAQITIKSATVSLGYANEEPKVEYKGTKDVQYLFYATRNRVNAYSAVITEQMVASQLLEFNVNPNIIRKVEAI